MNKQQKIIVSIVGITIVLLALLGITYAYYLTRIEGNTNTNSISVTTADLKLKYGDGNGLLTAANIMPGKQVEFKTTNNTTTTEKTFIVTNSGNSLVEGYAVSLDYAYIENVMPSIFERPEDFQITLTCSTNRTGETCNGFTGNFNNESIMMTSNDIEVGETHSYSLSIYYNDPQVDQSNDMGKNLNLKVQIYNINETTDIEGTITGVDSKYSVRIQSEPKMSTIINGKYNFKGIEVGTHTLTILDKDGNEVDKEYIVVKSGTTPGITTTKATIDDTEVDATEITITNEQRLAKLSTKVESNVLSFDTSASSTEVFNPYSYNKNSLAYQIINNAVTAKNNNSSTETIYSPIPLTSPGTELGSSNERTLSITQDDYGNSYYFRGNVKDNFVNYSGMCWRIVRILGNGNIKLILADENNLCSVDSSLNDDGSFSGYSSLNTTSAYIGGNDRMIISYNTPMNVLEEELYFANSKIEKVLELWKTGGDFFYNRVIDGPPGEESASITFEKKEFGEELVTSSWCNDVSMKAKKMFYNDENGDWPETTDINIATIIDVTSNAYDRIQSNNPTLKCDMVGIDGTSALKYSSEIAILSYDEYSFAGYGVNSYLNTNASSRASWTMTSYGYEGGSRGAQWAKLILIVNNSLDFAGARSYMPYEINNTIISIRPAITINLNSIVTKGNGTQSNPYVIQ